MKHPEGLAHDLLTLRFTRRRMLGLFGGAALIPIIGGCTTTSQNVDDNTVDAGSTDASSCPTEIPQETAGPYPGDGTNGPNALTETGIVRSDIRASFGTSTTVAIGVPLTITLTIVDKTTCAPLVGHAVYVWHCDQNGDYSMYSTGVTTENYLRGVQETDENGQVSFTSIFPACYSGRWPHIHYEIFDSLTDATSGNSKVGVSQLAMPKATCDLVYASTGYSASVTNLSQISLATDMVFSDGATLEIPTCVGTVAAGYTASLTAAI
jgi:protocatechuate 3,4-dioxygenase beta subunit